MHIKKNKLSKIDITVIIATKNDSLNLKNSFYNLENFKEVIVVDSNSKDETKFITLKKNFKYFNFNYKNKYPKKRQWALDNLKINSEWIFFLDSDEIITDSLLHEIKGCIKNDKLVAFMIEKEFYFMGKKMKYGGFSFKDIILFRNKKARFEKLFFKENDLFDMEVHERLIVKGNVGSLKKKLIHNDKKPLKDYLNRHLNYAQWEAELRYDYFKNNRYGINSIQPNILGNSQSMRRAIKLFIIKLPFEHILWFFYHYIFKLGFLEGYRGYVASKIRSNYIFDIKAILKEKINKI